MVIDEFYTPALNFKNNRPPSVSQLPSPTLPALPALPAYVCLTRLPLPPSLFLSSPSPPSSFLLPPFHPLASFRITEVAVVSMVGTRRAKQLTKKATMSKVTKEESNSTMKMAKPTNSFQPKAMKHIQLKPKPKARRIHTAGPEVEQRGTI